MTISLETHLDWEPRPGGWRTCAGTFVAVVVPLRSGVYSWVALDLRPTGVHGRGKAESLRKAIAGAEALFERGMESYE